MPEFTMTNDEFAKAKAKRCPSCQSSKIDNLDTPQMYPEAAYEKYACGMCGAKWTVLYRVEITGYYPEED